MATAKRRDQRSLILAQAGVLFCSMTKDQVQEFIRCGDLQTTDTREPAMPYDPEALKAMVESGALIGHELKG
jgi:hypothetical protein